MPTNNGKKTTQRATKKAQSTNTTASKVAAPVKAEVKPAVLKLDDGVLLNVRSNVYGGLVYINSRTGDKYEWNEFGDVQQLTAGDLRALSLIHI